MSASNAVVAAVAAALGVAGLIQAPPRASAVSCQPMGCQDGRPALVALAPRVVPERDQDSITKRLSPVTWLLKLTPRALAVTPSLVPGGACPPGSWIWQFTTISPSL
jgi:hypothetical protein